MIAFKTTPKNYFMTQLWMGVLALLLCPRVLSQNTAKDDESLLDLYANSKNNIGVIQFTPSNIKQFWVERSVYVDNNYINILLDSTVSIPLHIKLKNIDDSMDCTIEVIASTSDYSFNVTNSQAKTISKSKKNNDFLSYHVMSSSFHLSDTFNYSFNLQFNSMAETNIKIKRIFLFFSKNNSMPVVSNNKYFFNENNISLSKGSSNTGSELRITGKQTQIKSKDKFPVSNNTITSVVTLLNVGDVPTRIYVGYAVYSQDDIFFDGRNYPFKNANQILNIVSAKSGDNKIIVDSYPVWAKNCYLALDAKEDLSDIPSTNLLDGKVVDIQHLDDGKAEITFSKPLGKDYPSGTKIRVHGKSGDYIYTNKQVLNPGEEAVLTYEIAKDETYTQYTEKALSKGIYYIQPIILSYSVDADKENTIVVKDSAYSY